MSKTVSSDYEWVITDKYVICRVGNQNTQIPIEKFSQIDLDMIRGNHKCGGCREMPKKSFNSKKYSWCELSRKVAMYQSF